ncbi:hypothetical protein Pst134EB_022236 [Puccinia striiformis f. sp. tritici]|nr:hypothetical protein Pst134EB_022236 [Puccinia striiformis f. sp. tritici]
MTLRYRRSQMVLLACVAGVESPDLEMLTQYQFSCFVFISPRLCSPLKQPALYSGGAGPPRTSERGHSSLTPETKRRRKSAQARVVDVAEFNAYRALEVQVMETGRDSA